MSLVLIPGKGYKTVSEINNSPTATVGLKTTTDTHHLLILDVLPRTSTPPGLADLTTEGTH